MVTSKAKIETAESFNTSLLKSLSNFCEKCPLVVNPVIKGNFIILEREGKEDFTFEIDYSLEKKRIIYEIRQVLEPLYPVLNEIDEQAYTPKEYEQMAEAEGLPIVDVLSRKRTIKTPRYKIVRIINFYNELNVIDLQTNFLISYKLKRTPVLYFLKEMIEKNNDIDKASKVFAEQAELIKVLSKDYKLELK
jgi:hypothetical protein